MKRINICFVILAISAMGAGFYACVAGESAVVEVNGRIINVAPPAGTASNMVEWLIAQRIKQAIIDSAIQKSNITVPDDVLSKCVGLYIAAGGENPTNIVNAISSHNTLIVNALREVVLEHQNEDDVYNQHLNGIISQTEWRIWLKSYNSKERIDNLDSLIPHSVRDLKRSSRAGIRRDIEVYLLFSEVTNGVSASPSEVRSLYNKMYPNDVPKFGEVENEIKAKAAIQLRKETFFRWWQVELSENKISLPPEYSKVKELVALPPAYPFLPSSIVSILNNVKR
ncbi:MAG TPA: hypothetical protein VG077_11790 [Verrucomicrobiae bacterium]|nr:hypothetical protein [Verrucomicrobiae bacterium]